MKKRWILALTMLLCLCLLAACSSEPERFNVRTSSTGGAQTQTQQGASSQPEEDMPYDPLAEEDYNAGGSGWAEIATPVPVTATPAPTIRSEYAGATPVLIEPIDKPTPTSVPPLPEFKYQVYDATKLGLSFEAPMGWTKDDSIANTFIIQNPDATINYAATLTLRAENVGSQYSTSQLETVVRGMLDAIGTAGFSTYSPSDTASRTLLGKNGIYANYTGVLSDGRAIAGRVHAVCVDKVLYTVHITAPRAYWDDYKEEVYDKLRETIKITQ